MGKPQSSASAAISTCVAVCSGAVAARKRSAESERMSMSRVRPDNLKPTVWRGDAFESGFGRAHERRRRKVLSPARATRLLMYDPEELDAIRDAKESWESGTYGETVDRFGERKGVVHHRHGGQEVDPLYTPADIPDHDYREDLGNPGEEPYTRGVYSTMHRGRLWTMRQYAGMGTAAETNERFNYLIDQGSSGLSMAFDLPTQMGYDSDAAMAEGEVGRSGVAIDTLDDFETVFDGIPLDEVSTSMTINAPAAVLLAMYIAMGDKQGVPREQLRGRSKTTS